MQLFISQIDRKTVILDVEPTDTVQQVHNLIHTKYGIPQHLYYLTCGIKSLRGRQTDTLADCNVPDYATLYVQPILNPPEPAK